MKIYLSKEELELEKQMYADIAINSKVRIEYTYKDEKYLLIPYQIGDLIVLLEVNDEKEIVAQLLDKFVRQWVLENYIYPEEIKILAKHFKTELKKFKILVVKYNSPEEKEFSRYSLSNVTFGVVSHDNLDIHLLSANTEIKTKYGYSISDIVETPEEGLRQALLINKWFGGGNYTELPNIALEKQLEEKSDLEKWLELLSYVLFKDIDEKYFGPIINKLNEFKQETYFNPSKNIEKITLGILVSKIRK
ncbi:DUF4940 domain-containing protein [Fervidobacterium nodosum]|uniref:Uncharacterized protein n=1 Tax=Fervidobacterium nodosum (strain ATCC 35602 / DSM 5306 / Rt17-B1) TaxID=381764 RepID=A7HM01_FERNB|nr:DUF4940 domain-containing protein [Fervidobacterium nodosum]ABS60934.1 hypothetical protein Fnod_1086 [Fervidobacterium nodosum Rt17-B1]PHJ13671.1 hypothetical protein IM41_05015 [Fervidobacterium sp. SC_NGM5_G05]